MALGSSAPEILLATIETVSLNFEAGDLGPGTIVGSAAFNLFIITAICIVSVPSQDPKYSNCKISQPKESPRIQHTQETENSGEEEEMESGFRMIKEFGVFAITVVGSLFAYIWL